MKHTIESDKQTNRQILLNKQWDYTCNMKVYIKVQTHIDNKKYATTYDHITGVNNNTEYIWAPNKKKN